MVHLKQHDVTPAAPVLLKVRGPYQKSYPSHELNVTELFQTTEVSLYSLLNVCRLLNGMHALLGRALALLIHAH